MTTAVRALALAAVLSLALAACVSAYDPAVPSRLGLETRAEELGTAEPRTAPRPWFSRWRRTAQKPVQPSIQPTPPPAPTASQPAPVVPTLAEPGITIPDSLAGKQLAWWIAVLRGADTRNLEAHFSPDFLRAIPPAQLRQVARQWRTDELAGGPVELVRLEDNATPTRLTALVRGKATDRYTQIKLGTDAAGLITTLWLGPVVGVKRGDITDWAKLDAKFSQLAGQVNFAAAEVLPDNTLRPVHSFNDPARLALGSAFKLYILGALAEEVAAGRIKWDEPLAIKDDLKSLPSGQMQLENENAEFPIARFADFMISISDNTAADHLLARVGRDKIEAYMSRLNGDPARSLPFLATMEMFKLKLSPDRTLADRYAAADLKARRAMLADGGEVAKANPSLAAAALWKAPFHIADLEWFATAPEMNRLMADLHRLEQLPGMEPLGHTLRINPGLQLDSSVWKSIAYKGGSEPGVLNMTWLLQRDDGKWFAVSFGWNDTKQDVDIKTAADVISAGVALLGQEGR